MLQTLLHFTSSMYNTRMPNARMLNKQVSIVVRFSLLFFLIKEAATGKKEALTQGLKMHNVKLRL